MHMLLVMESWLHCGQATCIVSTILAEKPLICWAIGSASTSRACNTIPTLAVYYSVTFYTWNSPSESAGNTEATPQTVPGGAETLECLCVGRWQFSVWRIAFILSFFPQNVKEALVNESLDLKQVLQLCFYVITALAKPCDIGLQWPCCCWFFSATFPWY